MSDFINPVFVLLLGVFTGALIVQWRYLTRSTRPSQDLIALQQGLDLPPSTGDWTLHNVEMMTTEDRVAGVVSASFPDLTTEQRRNALTVLARELYRRIQVDAVLVEGKHSQGEPDLYLFAPDGRGWWGQEIISDALSGRDFTAAHRR